MILYSLILRQTALAFALLLALGSPCFADVTPKDTTEEIFKEALNYTVEIKTSTALPFSGDSAGTTRGAGFVVDKSRGWVLTNAHVVSRSPSRVEVALRAGEFVEAKKLFVDPYLDLALVEVGASLQSSSSASNAPISCAENPSVGHPVGAFGHPLGFKYTGTKGIVSGVSNRYESELLQTDAPINPGNSGGPLISLTSGKVVGVNTSTARGSQNTNFAVSMKYACTVIELLRAGKNPTTPQAPLIYYTDLDDRKLLRLAKSFLPADLLPLQNDDVILEVLKKPGKIDNETQLFDKLRGGLDDIELLVERYGKKVNLKGKLIPESDVTQRSGVRVSGILLAHSTGFRDLQDFNLPATRINYIEPGSLGGAAELSTGDYIESIDGVLIKSLPQLLTLLEAAQAKDSTVRLKIKRGGGNRSAYGYVDRKLKVEKVSWVGPKLAVSANTQDLAAQ